MRVDLVEHLLRIPVLLVVFRRVLHGLGNTVDHVGVKTRPWFGGVTGELRPVELLIVIGLADQSVVGSLSAVDVTLEQLPVDEHELLSGDTLEELVGLGLGANGLGGCFDVLGSVGGVFGRYDHEFNWFVELSILLIGILFRFLSIYCHGGSGLDRLFVLTLILLGWRFLLLLFLGGFRGWLVFLFVLLLFFFGLLLGLAFIQDFFLFFEGIFSNSADIICTGLLLNSLLARFGSRLRSLLLGFLGCWSRLGGSLLHGCLGAGDVVHHFLFQRVHLFLRRSGLRRLFGSTRWFLRTSLLGLILFNRLRTTFDCLGQRTLFCGFLFIRKSDFISAKVCRCGVGLLINLLSLNLRALLDLRLLPTSWLFATRKERVNVNDILKESPLSLLFRSHLLLCQ